MANYTRVDSIFLKVDLSIVTSMNTGDKVRFFFYGVIMAFIAYLAVMGGAG